MTNMKKIILSCAVCALLFAGCTKDKESDTSRQQQVTLSATDADSRTYLNSDKSLSWHTTDHIGVFAGSSSNAEFIINPSTIAGDYAQFTGSISGTPSTYYVYYPYHTSTTMSGSTLQLSLPSVQYATAGNLSPATNIAVAYSNTTSMPFRNVCAVLKFKITGSETLRRVVFKGAADEIVAGTGTVEMNYTASPVLLMTSGSKSVALEGSIMTGTAGTEYHLVVPPQAYNSGFSLRFEGDNGFMVASTSKPFTAKRSVITDLGTFAFSNTYNYDDMLFSISDPNISMLPTTSTTTFDIISTTPEGTPADWTASVTYYDAAGNPTTTTGAYYGWLTGTGLTSGSGSATGLTINADNGITATSGHTTTVDDNSVLRGTDPVTSTVSLSANGVANCYIVSAATSGTGKYTFDCTRTGGNAASGYHGGTTAISGATFAKVIWSDVNGLISVSSNCSSGVVSLTTAAQSAITCGNAVIGVYASPTSTQALWSWHIWVIPQPSDNTYGTPVNAKTQVVMNKTLGSRSQTVIQSQTYYRKAIITFTQALSGKTVTAVVEQGSAPVITSVSGHEVTLYQWGRKDPMRGVRNIYVGGTGSATSFYREFSPIQSSAYSGTDMFAYQNPAVMIINNNPTSTSRFRLRGDWFWDSDNSSSASHPLANGRWGDATGYTESTVWSSPKTVNDPCPAGYRVASGLLWSKNGFSAANSYSVSGSGRSMAYNSVPEYTLYNYSGHRRNDRDDIEDDGSAGYYWGSSPSQANATTASALKISSSTVDASASDDRADAHSVRCVKE